MLLGTSSQLFIRTDSYVAINLRPLQLPGQVYRVEMSSFSQESSVGNEVLVEKGKDSSVEIEEAVKNHVTDGAADTKWRSNTPSWGLFLIPTIYYALPDS